MTNPIQADAQLTNLSDDYIRDLEPENQRYDITLAQDFVISVLPNGIKTWAFIYDFQGRHRRKTLGVFPEMNFEDAKVSLEKARASMLRMDEPTVAPNEFGQLPAVLGGSHYVSKRKKKPIDLSFWLKPLAAALVVAAIAFLVISRPEWLSFASSDNETENNAEPADASLPFAVDSAAAKPAQTAPAIKTIPEVKPAPTPAPAVTTPRPAPVSSSTQSPPPETSQSVTPPTVATTPVSTPPVSPQANSVPANTNQATASAPPQPETKPVTALTTPSGATAYGGRVARSRLTSKVQDLEPVDTLGPEISYKNSGFTRVFYYTELREFGEGIVIHRWSLNGEVKEEVPLKVKQSWRWRTYSNKDITPGLNGEWKVETIDATGKILDTETFTYDYQ